MRKLNFKRKHFLIWIFIVLTIVTWGIVVFNRYTEIGLKLSYSFFSLVTLAIGVYLTDESKVEGVIKTICINHPRISELVINGSLVLCLLSVYCGQIGISKAIIQNNHSVISIVCMIFITIIAIPFIIFYIYEAATIRDRDYKAGTFVFLIVFLLIHVTQLFSEFYLVTLYFDKEAFQGFVFNDPTILCFDVNYYSLMTFINGSTSVVPKSIIAKSITVIEALVFVVGLSTIAFNLLNTKKKD